MHLRLSQLCGFGAALVLSACGSTPDPAWSGGIPRGKAAVVTLEHALTDPPRLIGMVNETHPGLQASGSSGEKSELRRSGIKSVPDASMDALLDRLQSQGFLDWSTPIEQVTPLDGSQALRGITVTVADQMRAFVVPRRPDPKLAQAYNQMSTSIQELFNFVVDMRLDPTLNDTNFYVEQQRLLDRERRFLKESGAGRKGPP